MAYHTLTWLAWLAAAAYLALANGQPLHTLLLIVATGMVFTVVSENARALGSHSGADPRVQGWRTFLRFGLWVWGIAALFNLLFAHAGRFVLFTLPRSWPLIGGPITLEGLLYGLANGASLFAVLLVFATFNLALDAHRLLRWLPGGLFQAGLIVSIALSFVPQIMGSLTDIREAQRVRGHRFRGIRDWVPLFVPLLTTALERSLSLAESMEARGFGGVIQAGETAASPGLDPLREASGLSKQEGHPGSETSGQDMLWSVQWVSLATLAGLLVLLLGLVWRATGWAGSCPSLLALVMGAGLLILALHLQGRRFKRTQYRREAWRWYDTWVSLACTLAVGMVLYTQVRNPVALLYYPYPPSSPWPSFTPLLGLASVLVAAPALLWSAGRTTASVVTVVEGE